ncbi:leucine-rich repeat domain-containing protein [Flammeovirga aprica]|uniref:Uncharacterized protein n=1 Tax=Flammeovirga aprica JL-4 TaxID=694437 RepID=A0A7X9RZD3_9BACT|nr:hypothetical protein [Flammeovirga aprica]NME71494.1 hypothetical protein [Flammeovirga aprica JL-4]
MDKNLINLFSVVMLFSIFSSCTEEEKKPNSIFDISGQLKIENISVSYKNEGAGIDAVFTQEDIIPSDIFIDFRQVEGGYYKNKIPASELETFQFPVGKYNATFGRLNTSELENSDLSLQLIPMFSGTFDFEIKEDETTTVNIETSNSEGYAITYDVTEELINAFGPLKLHVIQDQSEIIFDVDKEKKIFFASSYELGQTAYNGYVHFGIHLEAEIDDRPYYLSKIYRIAGGRNYLHFSLSDFTNPTDGFSQKHSLLNFKEYALESANNHTFLYETLTSWTINNDLSEFENIELNENGHVISFGVSHLMIKTGVVQSLPKSFLNFPELEALTISQGDGVKLWDNIGDLLPNLSKLSLEGTTVTLPESIYKLDLTHLNMYSNHLNDEMVSKILGFSNIEYLRFHYTESFPDVRHLKNLKNLRLNSSFITEEDAPQTALPSWIGDLQQLEEFGIEGTRILEFPASMKELKNLKILYLRRNDLKEFPDFIKYLPQLEEITLAENKLEGEFPMYLTNFQHLKYLSLSDNKLSGPLPVEIANMPALKRLVIVYNYFTEADIPEELKNADFEFLYFGQQEKE